MLPAGQLASRRFQDTSHTAHAPFDVFFGSRYAFLNISAGRGVFGFIFGENICALTAGVLFYDKWVNVKTLRNGRARVCPLI